jgi:hypothetical protein
MKLARFVRFVNDPQATKHVPNKRGEKERKGETYKGKKEERIHGQTSYARRVRFAQRQRLGPGAPGVRELVHLYSSRRR